MQWLALLPNSKKILGLNPLSDWAFSVWRLHVLFRYTGFPPQSKHTVSGIKLPVIGDSKLGEWLAVSVLACPVTWPVWCAQTYIHPASLGMDETLEHIPGCVAGVAWSPVFYFFVYFFLKIRRTFFFFDCNIAYCTSTTSPPNPKMNVCVQNGFFSVFHIL